MWNNSLPTLQFEFLAIQESPSPVPGIQEFFQQQVLLVAPTFFFLQSVATLVS
jgi:hypothetical protein